ncbi:MAG: S-adenosylmethionine:tRNA ribosyltransferase-isomerase, partial [Hyphomicrobiales bacterium]
MADRRDGAPTRIDDYDFDLPETSIALHPAVPRDPARLLVVPRHGRQGFDERIVAQLPDLLRPGDALVLNDTRVIPAALKGVRQRGDTTARVAFNLDARPRPLVIALAHRGDKLAKLGRKQRQPRGCAGQAEELAPCDFHSRLLPVADQTVISCFVLRVAVHAPLHREIVRRPIRDRRCLRDIAVARGALLGEQDAAPLDA